MAPPPSPNLPRVPTPLPQPPDTGNHIEPLSSATASTTVSVSPLPASREEVDAAIAVVERKLAGRVVRKVFSRKTARPHIYQDAHKARVLETRKEDQEALVKHLYELERARGYTSDFQTFQGFLKYRELLDGQGIMSSHLSLADLRRRYKSDEQRRHSHGDNITPDFLERALQRAKETLNGPKPPPPFIPSFEQLRIARRDKDAEINSRIRGPPLPSALSPEDDAEVSRLLGKRGIIAKVASLQVSDADLSRLRPGTWLNDEVINFYGQLILDRSASHPRNTSVKNGARSEKGSILNVHYFNSFFFEKLVREGYQKARLAKWTKKFDLFSKDVALIPINHGNSHWTAAAINFRRRRIESFDSMGVKRQDVFDLLREYVELEHLNKKSKPFDWTGWVDYCPRDTPQQENGYDCGVFTCQFLEALSRGVDSPFNFTQRNMAYLRRRMILEIARTELLGGT
ncbi:cysteine proteinase [Lactarius pseudohatsudake]|nr:cysteine proteinase [Lactarius pseudohatsudake]